MNINEFKKLIKSRTDNDIQDIILEELYKYRGMWCINNNESIYIIGLSEDRWDNYYIYINNHEKNIKFMTCLNKLEPHKYVVKNFNKDEINNIKEVLNRYFENNKTEKLLYNIYE